jgi:hypothetical protein
MMKFMAIALLAFAGVAAFAPSSDAAVCARGYYGAGCVGRHGAVAVRHGAYYRPHYYHRRVVVHGRRW